MYVNISTAVLAVSLSGSVIAADAAESSAKLMCEVSGTAICGEACTGAGVNAKAIKLKIDRKAQIFELNGVQGTFDVNAAPDEHGLRPIHWEFELIRLDQFQFHDDPRFVSVSLYDGQGRRSREGGRELYFRCR